MKNRPLAQGLNHQAVLKSLNENGPATYLELETRLQRAGLHRVANYLQQNHFIKGLPKKRGLLRVYDITKQGRRAIGMAEEKPDFTPTDTHVYQGLELRDFTGRTGAMDAYYLPSKIGNKLHYRDGRVEVLT